MKSLFSLGLIFIALTIFSCKSLDKSNVKESQRIYGSLTEYLQTLPGVQVTGNDNNGHVRLTGMGIVTTKFADDSPLFVVDGQQIGRSLFSLSSVLNPNDIKKAKVLRTPEQTSIYGIRGASGVIEITTKKK